MSIELGFDTTADLSSPSGEVPVWLRIDGMELLGSEDRGEPNGPLGHGLPLALLHFSTWGLVCLRHAQRSGRYAIELDDYGDALIFVLAGDDITVHSPRWDQTAAAPFPLLYEAWREFALEARDFIVRRFPAAAADPRWRRLTADDRSPAWLESARSPSWFAPSRAPRLEVGVG